VLESKTGGITYPRKSSFETYGICPDMLKDLINPDRESRRNLE
jgi:hypothetical protein